jgi:hypothetical protein
LDAFLAHWREAEKLTYAQLGLDRSLSYEFPSTDGKVVATSYDLRAFKVEEIVWDKMCKLRMLCSLEHFE